MSKFAVNHDEEQYGWQEYDPETYHYWRWRFLWCWMTVLSIIVIIALGIFRSDTPRLSKLEQSNCALKQFLYTARNARLDAAARENGEKQDNDLRAANGYQVIADRITATGRCALPAPPKLPKPKS